MATVPPNTTATLIVPVRDSASPKLTESGQTCQLVEEEGRFSFKVNPGEYIFNVEYE